MVKVYLTKLSAETLPPPLLRGRSPADPSLTLPSCSLKQHMMCCIPIHRGIKVFTNNKGHTQCGACNRSLP